MINNPPESDGLISGKSFKINRKNINVAPNSPKNKFGASGLTSLSPMPKNNSEMKKSSDIRLNELKMSHSQAKRLDIKHELEDPNIDAKLRRLRRDHQPKLNSDDTSKYEYRDKDFENSLQMNIDFLASLKRDGFSKDRLLKR
jgi:hypothetical protein